MIVYQVCYDDLYMGNAVEWAATKQEAKMVKKKLQKQGYESPYIFKFNIPTGNRRDLVAWLNANFPTDNG